MAKDSPKTFIPFYTNYGFLATFGNDKLDEEFLKHALPLLVGRETPLKKVERKQSEIVGETLEGKGTRLDLLCTDENGDIYLVEMQLGHQAFFFERMMYYAFQQFIRQFNRGDEYKKEIATVYAVGISYGDIWEGGSWYDDSVIKNRKCETRSEKLVFITVELAKFDKQVKAPSNPLEEFIYMLKHLQDFKSMQQMPNFTVQSWMQGAFEELRMANLDPLQRTMVEADIVWLRDMLTTDERNKWHYLKKGEKVKAREVVIRALKKGTLGLEDIADISGLPLKTVKEIKQAENL